MPCRDGGPDPREEAERNAIAENDRHVMARLACDSITAMLKAGKPVPDWARGWWERHQEHDRKRLAEENRERAERKRKQAALSKLSAEDRAALGV